MYLKSIELHGFKSFIDKTKLSFKPGVSVIVGPNGSGKSNITDAIRWVLGEQSIKALRGSKMEDVIFAGTKKRKPLGMAEVCLTLDNSDGFLPLEFSEVTVTRRTYRSGEGEFFINNVPCRLKDLHSLFMDTGMGGDGFSIIGQDKVVEILTSRPEERRGIIEETAGIVKYRNRKKEALRKLEDTEESLQRIQDIVYELSHQLAPLKTGAEKASYYQELKGERDCLEINLLVHILEDLKEKLSDIAENISNRELKIWELEALKVKLESQIAELRLQLEIGHEEINDLQQQVFQLHNQGEQVENQEKLLFARRDTLQDNLSRLKQELEGLTEEMAKLTQSYNEEERKQIVLAQSIKEHEESLLYREEMQKGEARSILTAENKIETLKNRAFDLVQLIADLRNNVSNKKQRMQTLTHLLSRAKNQEREFLNLSEENISQVKSLKIKTEKGKKNFQDIKEKIAELKKNICQLEDTEKSLAAGEKQKREELQILKGRWHLLREMQQTYEGYYPGVKSILLAVRKKQMEVTGVIGVIAELIKVPEHIQIAVETALGGALQNIVTETEQDGKKAIQYLKSIKGGRATFLPLNVLNKWVDKNLKEKIKGIDGVLGLAIDLVSCTEQVRPAINFLLKSIVVTENMEGALTVAKALKYQTKVVTLEGDLINPGGSLTGGSRQKKSGNLLTRMGEITNLEHRSQQLTKKIDEVEKKSSALRQTIEHQQIINKNYQDELSKLEFTLTAWESEGKQFEAAAGIMQKNISTIGIEIASYQEENQNISKEIILLNEKLHKKETEKAQLMDLISAEQEKIKELKENLTEKNEDLTEIRVNMAAKVQEEISLKATLARLNKDKETGLALINEKKEEMHIITEQLSKIDGEQEEIKNTILQLKGLRMEKDQILSEKKHQVGVGDQSLGELEKKEKETYRLLAAKGDDLHQWQLKQNRWEAEWEKNIEKLREKFHLDLEEALLKKEELSSVNVVNKRIREIDQEIEDLGEVNLSAIAEYQRVSERYGFLTEQQQDLLEARSALFKVIKEMSEIMEKKFKETFSQVSAHFNQTFHRLFGGGHGELILTNPKEILETGVDIVVQPPGKKLQHLSLLSGGEKAMTGIALLFAILNVKPSPFCVLDEIEAALDEANIDRFAAFMQDLSRNTQFIAVSHRQGTMEIADVLYGITMEEKGVSKSISVKLTDLGEISA